MLLKPVEFKHIKYDLRDHVVTITIDRPERRNALNWRAYAELEAAFLAIEADIEVRCAILTGTDPAFCSGDDVSEIMAGDKKPQRRLMDVRMDATPAAAAALSCHVPLIAAVNGAAVGWGMELALFADIRLASRKAKFAELFVKRGLICDIGGLTRLPAIVGPAKAAELLFSGAVIDADEAYRIGLVSEILLHEELLTRAREMADQIAANPPLALRWMKEGLRRGQGSDPVALGGWTTETILALMQTHDHQEGVASFLEKRAPIFRGC